ncbi:MAG TPA: PAS domain S-box protein [Chitinophagaceae bacterium]|nr:PAS domain S-box protein [Chitinophagaceae bacterium]
MKQVIDFFSKLFDTADWPPRWHCGKWSDFHGWLYIISDLLIWAAYFAIPIIIIRFITYKKHQQFIKLYFLFAAFILACGATHFLDAITFWFPVYRLSALMRAITAIVSWLTVFSLIKIVPLAFSLKSPRELETEIEMRKKAEAELQIKNQQLEESRKTFKSAFDYSTIGIALVSPEGNWLTVNQALCDMLGYTEAELLKLTFQDITHPDDLAQDLAYVKQVLNKEIETYQMEKRYYTKSGRIVYALLSVSLVWKDNNPDFFVSQIVNISQQKKLALEIERKNLALEKANDDLQVHLTRINEFNRIVGHNLRGPATSLINAADFLETTDNEEDKNLLLSKLKGTASLILSTINDLRDFIEIQLTQSHTAIAASFKTAFNKSTAVLADEIKKTNAVINVDFKVEKVFFPQVYLESIFYNLLSNALKYIDASRQPVISIETKTQRGSIVLSVKDNGIGIDLKRHGKEIFKYRKIFHKGYDSNGVGLFLTKTQLETYDGGIEVESQPGKGTTFYIYFKQV